jgi:hypothetical protein
MDILKLIGRTAPLFDEDISIVRKELEPELFQIAVFW